MSDVLTARLHDEAARLLGSGEVDFVLGHSPSPTLPGRAVPFHARTVADAVRLVIDHTCSVNLAGLVKTHHRRSRRFAVVAKGCDGAGLVSLFQERQLRREQVVVIAPVCQGMVDPWRIDDRHDTPNPPSGLDDPRLQSRCRTCLVRHPSLADILLDDGPAAPAASPGPLPEPAPWASWRALFARCIRCGACRRACPVCACASCIFESTTPVWVDRSPNPSDNALFSLVRLWHMAGRCVGCGECERVCPVGIPFGRVTSRLAGDAEALFGLRPGTDPTAARILSTVDEAHDAALADFIL